jgi:prevent-host-death family protein
VTVTYQSLPRGFDIPEVETVLIDRRDVEAMGAGETTITQASAAAHRESPSSTPTGARIREVPFTEQRLRVALLAGLGEPCDAGLALVRFYLLPTTYGEILPLDHALPVSKCLSSNAIITSIGVTDMIREASAMKVRQNLGDLLNEVQYRKSRILITKAGKPVAALVDLALFERIQKLDDEFDALTRKLAQAFENLPAEQGTTLVDEAVRAVREDLADP